MEKTMAKKKKSKQDLFYEEARSLYITGWELQKIAKALGVPLKTLKNWQSFGHWERKKELVAEHPKLIGEALKGLVKQKVKTILDNKNELNSGNIDELNKLISLIERLEEQSWDERAAVVEVMSLFGDFARRQVGEKEELQLLAKLMEKFFEEMEGT
jgi:uncharacterized protein YjcR